MPEKKISLSIVTPEEQIYEGKVNSIVIPAVTGLMGILPGHLPIVSQLGIGIVKIETEKGAEYIGIQGGYLDFLYNKANILTARAIVTTFEKRKETVGRLKEKHKIVQEITEETKKVARAIASLKTLRK
jgi:F-type H+-transporting ATPase subunit epsilon